MRLRTVRHVETRLLHMVKPIVFYWHGWGASGTNRFFGVTAKCLRDAGFTVFHEDFPDTMNPEWSAWSGKITEVIDKNWNGEPIMFVAHSLGGYTIMKYIMENIKAKWITSLKTLMLVSPVGVLFEPCHDYTSAPIDYHLLSTLKTKVVLLYSHSDDVLVPDHSLAVKNGLGSMEGFEYIETEGDGHYLDLNIPIINEITLRLAQEIENK